MLFDSDYVNVKLKKKLSLNNDEKNSLFKFESQSLVLCTLVLISIVLSFNNNIFTSIIAKGEFQ